MTIKRNSFEKEQRRGGIRPTRKRKFTEIQFEAINIGLYTHTHTPT